MHASRPDQHDLSLRPGLHSLCVFHSRLIIQYSAVIQCVSRRWSTTCQPLDSLNRSPCQHQSHRQVIVLNSTACVARCGAKQRGWWLIPRGHTVLPTRFLHVGCAFCAIGPFWERFCAAISLSTHFIDIADFLVSKLCHVIHLQARATRAVLSYFVFSVRVRETCFPVLDTWVGSLPWSHSLWTTHGRRWGQTPPAREMCTNQFVGPEPCAAPHCSRRARTT